MFAVLASAEGAVSLLVWLAVFLVVVVVVLKVVDRL